jgi:hypothetical protein
MFIKGLQVVAELVFYLVCYAAYVFCALAIGSQDDAGYFLPNHQF